MTARINRLIWTMVVVELLAVVAVGIVTSNPGVTSGFAYLLAALNLVLGVPAARSIERTNKTERRNTDR